MKTLAKIALFSSLCASSCYAAINSSQEVNFRPLAQKNVYFSPLDLETTDVINSNSELLPLNRNWQHKDPLNDRIYGISTERAYEKYPLPIPRIHRDIVVAVIDTGVDINHFDLKNKIWINHDEIPNNGIDDDGNGYIDDVMGWNFIGSSDYAATFEKDEEGFYKLIPAPKEAHLQYDSFSDTRRYAYLLMKKENGSHLTVDEELELDLVSRKIKKERNRFQNLISKLNQEIRIIKFAQEIVTDAGLFEITIESLQNFRPSNQREQRARRALLQNELSGISIERIQEQIKKYEISLNYFFELTDQGREEIVGDNPHNPDEYIYGNNDVIGTSPDHGTHIAGIIAADRNNGIGIKGIAEHVKIMPLRILPHGDERDKDVANAILYAVNNGAKIINLSFSKLNSNYEYKVVQAIEYAKNNDVLIVHSAGNESLNLDLIPSYPRSHYVDEQGRRKSYENWIEVGASGSIKNRFLATQFSNFGKKSVDVFAPGVEIISTISNDRFSSQSGTSMAAPMISGMAAVLLAHNPNLTAKEVKKYITRSARKITGVMISKNGVNAKYFSQLSKTGGIPNLYYALKSLYRKMKRNGHPRYSSLTLQEGSQNNRVL